MLIQSSAPSPLRSSSLSSQPKAEKAERDIVDSIDEFIKGNEKALLGGTLGAAAYVGAAAYPSTWAHEMGHAIAIEKLYTNGQPTVEVFPFEGGVTRWRPSELTPLGEKFGKDGARAMVAASGTLVDIGISTTAFGAGFALRKKSPIVGHALMGYGAMTMLNSVMYAGSAVGANLGSLSATGNDFATIGVKAGIPPIASMAILASILPLQYVAMRALEGNEEAASEAKPRSVFEPAPNLSPQLAMA